MGHYSHLSHCWSGDDHHSSQLPPHDWLAVYWVTTSLEDESDIRLGADLLGRRYAMETICYTDLESYFMKRPQLTAEECLRMARVILLYLLGAYLFANGG